MTTVISVPASSAAGISAAGKLGLYNDALLLCGERFLSSLTEEREPRRLLDQVWSAGNGAIHACLEEGQWRFATRTSQIDYDPSIEPTFGYPHAFVKPPDWVSTIGVCGDEYFRVPLTRYVDEAGFWYSDLETIYVRYISNDEAYGNNLAAMPEAFRQYVAVFLASKIIKKLSNSESEVKDIFAMREKALLAAKANAAKQDPETFPARGTWSSARNRYPNRRDGGNINGPLIG